MNNDIAESDFDEWTGCDNTSQFTIHVTEIGKNQILNNQAIVERIKDHLKQMTDFKDTLQDGTNNKLIADAIFHTLNFILNVETTVHSKCFVGDKS